MELDLTERHPANRELAIREHYWLYKDHEVLSPGANHLSKLIRSHATSLGIMLASSIDDRERMNRIFIYLDGVVDELEEGLLEERNHTTLPFATEPGFDLHFYRNEEEVEKNRQLLKRRCEESPHGA